jgi:MFS family permease
MRERERRARLPVSLPAWTRGNMRWLLATRAVRSFTQAVLVIAVPLYATAAGFSSLQVGMLLSFASLGSIGLVLLVGLLADRWGRKPLLLGLALLSVAGAAVYAQTTAFWPLAVVGAIAAIGRGGGAGSGGAWGPFYPAEQPLVAASVAARDQDAAFAGLSFVGVLAGAAGSLLAVLPDLLMTRFHLGAVDAWRPLFWLTAAGGVGLAALTLPIKEVRLPRRTERAHLQRASLGVIGRLWLTNGLNGLALGVLGPFLTYWFAVRYGVGASEISMLYTLVNLLTALPYLGSAALARRLGPVAAVVATRAGAVLGLVALALAPTFSLAAVAYVVRVMITAVGMPIRQSFVMSISVEQDRSTVAALGSLPAQVTAMAAPALAAHLLESVSQEAPIWFAAMVMATNTALYAAVFSRLPPSNGDHVADDHQAVPGAASAGGAWARWRLPRPPSRQP